MNHKKYLSIEEVISLPTYSQIKISNDGNKLALIKKVTNWQENKYQSELWIYSKQSNQLVPLINKIDISSPGWSPDSEYLAYLAKTGEKGKEKKQLFVIEKNNFAGIQITSIDEGVTSFKWAHDSKGLFFTSKNPDSQAIKKRNEVYGEFTHLDHEHNFNTLYYVDYNKVTETIDSEPPGLVRQQLDFSINEQKNDNKWTKVIGGNFHIKSFDISPKGDKIVYTKIKTPLLSDYLKATIFLYDMPSKSSIELTMDTLIGTELLFSPDGGKICFRQSSNRVEHYEYNIYDFKIAIYDINTTEIELPISHLDIDAYPVSWLDNGLLIRWQSQTNMLAGVLSPDGKILNPFGQEDIYISSISVAGDGRNMAYIKATSKQLFEVYLNDKQLTVNSNLFATRNTCQKKVVTWLNSEGIEISGILTLPPDFDTTRKYPLLLSVHGGPRWASFRLQANNRYYPIEQFIEKGFLILEPNYRGSSGYGEEFVKSNHRKLGTGDYDDIITGMDNLISKGFIDENRIGIMGWSQGGYISAFCSTYSKRFKAISVGAGISDWKTYYIQTDVNFFTKSYLGNDPWREKAIYEKTSPMNYIKTACTPTLIQHGESDERVPVSNAYELYLGLKDMNVKTELVIFKGMEHGANKPGLHRAIMKQNLAWFCHYILGEDLTDFRIM